MSEPCVIALHLRSSAQLFNSFDPSPFTERDLDRDAAEYIVSSARECHASQPLVLRLHLDEATGADLPDLSTTLVAEGDEWDRFCGRADETSLLGRWSTDPLSLRSEDARIDVDWIPSMPALLLEVDGTLLAFAPAPLARELARFADAYYADTEA